MAIRTVSEAQTWRAELDKVLRDKVADDTSYINESLELIRVWQPGSTDNPIEYNKNDVRVENDIPYKCISAHTHRGEADWNPSKAVSLWSEYHGTSPETARAWKKPTGAHDQYLKDEYMIWTDGKIKHCKQDTVYSPSEYTQAWEDVDV